MPRKTAVKDDNSFLGLLTFAKQELDAPLRRGNRLSYKPYPKQCEFHQSDRWGRYISGGNRAGKTDSEVMEAIWWCTNTHPYLPRPEAWGDGPIRARFVVVDIVKGVEDIILPKLKRWCASTDLINGKWDDSWDSRQLMFTFSNGSTIQFLTHGMELDKHGGVPLHCVFFDEIPPQNIFNENMMRLIDFNGFWVMAATAVQGLGWTYDRLWEPWEEGKAPDLFCIQLSQKDNPYLEAEEEDRSKFYIAMDDGERMIREDGAFVAKSGLVFPTFSLKTHVLAEPLPFEHFRDWQWYSSADFGWNNPTAWLWHAVAPDGRIYTFSEHYRSFWTVDDHAALVHERETRLFHKAPDIRVGDPAGNQKQMNTGTSVIQEYATRGIYISTETIPKDASIGMEKMQQYFKIRPLTGWGENTPTWMISPDCGNFVKELKKLQFEAYESDKKSYDSNKKETVRKKDDHAYDSAKYFATLMPDLRPILEATEGGTKHLSMIEFYDYVKNTPGVELANDSWDTREVEEFDEDFERFW